MAYKDQVITGTDGPETLYGYGGDDALYGLKGDDELRGGTGDDRLFGNDGMDQLHGGPGDDRLLGGAGDDQLIGGDGNDRYWLDADNRDRVEERAGGGIDEVVTDHYYFTLDQHSLSQVENLTTVSNRKCLLYGNALDNVISSGRGEDVLFGDYGDDILKAGMGDDQLYGGPGDDRLLGGLGWDQMYGGTGDDVYSVIDDRESVNEEFGEGYDSVFAVVDYQLRPNVEKLTLGGAATAGYGNHGDNLLIGHDGGVRLRGANGNDELRGGADDDDLGGGLGIDRATGGGGGDAFKYLAGDAGASRRNADAILDFSQADGDSIALDGIDAVSTSAGNDRFTFIGSGAFSGAAGELHARVVNGNTFVEADTDGDKVADLVIRLSGEIVLTASDFVL
jgi:Ca2+-binding RTX toxin-like protein